MKSEAHEEDVRQQAERLEAGMKREHLAERRKQQAGRR